MRSVRAVTGAVFVLTAALSLALLGPLGAGTADLRAWAAEGEEPQPSETPTLGEATPSTFTATPQPSTSPSPTKKPTKKPAAPTQSRTPTPKPTTAAPAPTSTSPSASPSLSPSPDETVPDELPSAPAISLAPVSETTTSPVAVSEPDTGRSIYKTLLLLALGAMVLLGFGGAIGLVLTKDPRSSRE